MTRYLPRLLPCVSVLAAIALLAGCGFHLRDALLLPPDLGPLQVTSADRDGPLVQQLQLALARAGASMVEIAGADADAAAPAPAAAPAQLRILSERFGDTPISVDRFGRSQEFNLRYAVVFDLRRGDG
ncbi:MAG: hypothetical protein ABIR05_04365, partial [Luteimonas sp.]